MTENKRKRMDKEQKKKDKAWKKLNRAKFEREHKKVFFPHFLWCAFCITKPKVGFVKFDFDTWSEESFVKKGFCRYDTETKDVYIETEKYKLIWIPCGFRFFMWF